MMSAPNNISFGIPTYSFLLYPYPYRSRKIELFHFETSAFHVEQ